MALDWNEFIAPAIVLSLVAIALYFAALAASVAFTNFKRVCIAVVVAACAWQIKVLADAHHPQVLATVEFILELLPDSVRLLLVHKKPPSTGARVWSVFY